MGGVRIWICRVGTLPRPILGSHNIPILPPFLRNVCFHSPPASDFELDAQIYLSSKKAVLSVWRLLPFVLPSHFFQPLRPIFAFKSFPIFLLGLETNYDVNVIVSMTGPFILLMPMDCELHSAPRLTFTGLHCFT
jgi:hypothetical protein